MHLEGIGMTTMLKVSDGQPKAESRAQFLKESASFKMFATRERYEIPE